jgi:hypothetical protein
MRERIEDMGFGRILKLAAKSLDERDFISWLMDRFDPENMVIEIGGRENIAVTEYAIHCVFGLPFRGDNHPIIINKSAKKILEQVASSLFPDNPESKFVKINPNKAAERIELYHTNG